MGANGDRPRHLDPVALATPSLAISCAAREAMHQADVVETMLRGMLTVIRSNDLALAEQLRKLDDTVDQLYSAIKFYLTQISRQALSERESRKAQPNGRTSLPLCVGRDHAASVDDAMPVDWSARPTT